MVLADSDIRKALLLNVNINKSIRNIFNRKPYFVFKNEFTYNDLRHKISDRRLGIIPIVNKKKNLKKIIFLNKFLKINIKLKNPVVFIAGAKVQDLHLLLIFFLKC